MPTPYHAILKDSVVCAAFKQAWQDSQPGITGGHEEGGFVLRDPLGSLSVVRWPRGEQDVIILPPHSNCKVGERDLVATFHIHPNTGSDYLQEPGETDRRAVRDDRDLKGQFYAGEFVISCETIYLIAPNGQVSEEGFHPEILDEG